ncbi:MAG: J domain-containing protein [Leptospiraceae bacterium]
METVESCLSLLELETLPDERTLKRSFRKAMLMVHPDRNPENRQWAEERSREIIQAYELISDELRNRSGVNSGKQPSWTTSGWHPDSQEVQHFRSNHAKAGPEKYQVVITAEARYAMPLRWMKTVVRFEEVVQKRGFHGAMVMHNNRMYPVFSVRGRSATCRPGHALILFEWSGGRAAMVLGHSVEHFYTLEMDYREIFWSRKSDGTVRLLRGGQALLFPAFLVPVMEAENRIFGQSARESGMPV